MKNQSGFSLIELMITVAIIGILATVAIPNLDHYVTTARVRRAESELAGMKVIVEAYHAELSYYPQTTRAGVTGLTHPWLGRADSFFAPSSNCAGISDSAEPLNGEALRSLCEEVQKLPPVYPYASGICMDPRDWSYLYTGQAPTAYKLITHCSISYPTKIADPVRDGGPNGALVDGQVLHAFGFWSADGILL